MDDFSHLSREELEDALKSVQSACAQAIESEQQQSKLVSTTSHELRTPLSAIVSMAELLLTTPLNETQKRYALTMQKSAQGLISVLNDILDYYRIGASKEALHLGPLDLDEFLMQFETELEARASDKRLEWSVNRADNLPMQILVDRGRVRQILNNLLDNALKFTAEGSVSLRVDCKDLDNHQEFDALLVLEVIDTGIGISPDEQLNLFQPFSQANNKISDTYGGSGLGLSIVQRLVNMMGGKIRLKSSLGEGSSFEVEIPCKIIEALDRKPKLVDIDKMIEEEPIDNQINILVVEDNPVNSMLVSAFLDKFGHSYLLVNSGQDALIALSKDHFDVILMDIRMAGMDGIETTKAIRSLKGPKSQTPIIALTAHAMDHDRVSYLDAGMDDYVSKPIDPKALFVAIQNAVNIDRCDNINVQTASLTV